MTVLRGGRALEAKLAEISKRMTSAAEVQVGFLEGARYPDGTSVALVAATQNFGAPAKGIPPRPFFTNMIDKHGNEWGGQLEQLLVRTGGDARLSLEMMGQHIQGQLREEIIATNSPPNAMATNLLKQRFPMGGQSFQDVLKAWSDAAAGVTAPAGKPLVHTGHMLGSVDSEVK